VLTHASIVCGMLASVNSVNIVFCDARVNNVNVLPVAASVTIVAPSGEHMDVILAIKVLSHAYYSRIAPFLQRNAMSARYAVDVCLSVCHMHAGIVSQRLNVRQITQTTRHR